MYLLSQQFISLKLFLHSQNEWAETNALLDCGAMENLIHANHAWRKRLLIKILPILWKIINVNSTQNAQGEIKYYVDLEMIQGQKKVNHWFFLTDIGDWDMILGYPWFAAIQPNIN